MPLLKPAQKFYLVENTTRSGYEPMFLAFVKEY